jgi:ERCC4-type nuclease
MFIKIDVREHELIQAVQFLFTSSSTFKELILVIEQLPLGDIIICDDKEEKLIIERKTLKDLSSSIKDGRYEEQSYRLSGINHPNHNIIYLIEGSMDKFNMFKGHGDKTTLYSAMVSLNYFKGFSVMRSLSVEESALMICNCAIKISKSEQQGRTAFYKNVVAATKVASEVTAGADVDLSGSEVLETETQVDVQESSKNYCQVVKKVKKDNVTLENIGEIMLCQIPGISSVTAIAIMSRFKTVPNLIMSLKNDLECMKDISYTTSAGQTRKINKTCIASIIKYLSGHVPPV